MGHPKYYNAQNSLLKKMNAIGYDVVADGVCAGVTMVAIESAINHGDLTYFDVSIKYITSSAFKPKRIKSSIKLFPPIKDEATLNAHATLDQIQLYHKPDIYHDLFTHTVSQHESAAVAALAQSNKSISQQGFVSQNNWSWAAVYTEKSLKSLLDAIQTSCTDNQLLAFKLGNIDHQIALIFKNGNWTLMNINEMPSRTYRDTSNLAKKLRRILGNKNNNMTTVNFTTFSSGVEKEETQVFIDKLYQCKEFTHSQHISKRIINNPETFKLAQLAICNHQVDLLNKLIKKGLDINTVTPSGFSLVYLAAQYGYTDILTSLIQAGAAINTKEGEHGVSPLLIATEHQHHATISLLIEHGATVAIESNDHVTPLVMAANNGDIDSLKLLTQHGAKLNESTFFGTPLEIAQNAGKSVAAQFIENSLIKK